MTRRNANKKSLPDSIWNYEFDAGDGHPGGQNANEDNESIMTDMMSPSGHADAQTLACMLQEQLDAINNEIRYDETHSVEIYEFSYHSDFMSN